MTEFPLASYPGLRIRLIHMDTTDLPPDAPPPPAPGTLGTVVGGNERQVWVRWDGHPQSLCLLPGTDVYEIVTSESLSPEWAAKAAAMLNPPTSNQTRPPKPSRRKKR